jgi:hypothetical protein
VIVVLSLGFGLAPGPVASLPGKIRNPVWARRTPLVIGYSECWFPAAGCVHPRFGGELGVALPAF